MRATPDRPLPEFIPELATQPWRRDALCIEYRGSVNFFPGRGESTQPAKSICSFCVVRDECLEYALNCAEPLAGIWGGLSEQQRKRLRHQP